MNIPLWLPASCCPGRIAAAAVLLLGLLLPAGLAAQAPLPVTPYGIQGPGGERAASHMPVNHARFSDDHHGNTGALIGLGVGLILSFVVETSEGSWFNSRRMLYNTYLILGTTGVGYVVGRQFPQQTDPATDAIPPPD